MWSGARSCAGGHPPAEGRIIRRVVGRTLLRRASFSAVAALLLIGATAARALASPCAGSGGGGCPYASVTILGQRAEGVLRFPEAVALDGQGDLYVADQLSYVVEKFTLAGAFQTQWGSYGSRARPVRADRRSRHRCPGRRLRRRLRAQPHREVHLRRRLHRQLGAQRQRPRPVQLRSSKTPSQPPGGGIAVAGDYVYVADSGNNRVERFNLEGGEPMQWGSEGSGPGQFDYPRAIAANAAEVIVSDDDNHRIEKFDPNGNLKAIDGTAGTGDQFGYPYGVSSTAPATSTSPTTSTIAS